MSNVESFPTPRRTKVREVGVQKLMKVRHWDYGDGQIVSDMGQLGVGIHWEKPIVKGLNDHFLMHDRSWVDDLDVIE